MADRNLMEVAKRAASVATKAGAKDARVFVNRTRDISVEWRDGKLDRIQESTSQGLYISLYVDGRYSSNSTSDLRPEALDKYVETSVAATKYLAVDEHRKLPDPSRYAGVTAKDLEKRDPSIGSITPEQRLAKAEELEDASRAGDDGRIISVTTWVGDTEGMWVGFSTNGFEGSEEGTKFSWGTDISVEDTDDRKPSGWDYGSTRFFGDLPPIDRIGRVALERGLAQLGSKQVKTDKYEVVVENRAAPTLFKHLISPLSGSAIQQKRSFMEGKIGEKIGSDLLTVTSDPHLPRGLSSSAWDNEGMATTPRPVFTEGTLKTFFLDTYYASKLGMEPTTSSISNLVWNPGDRSPSEMIAGMKRGIYVTSFLGGNSNSTTGDFSLGIKGHYVEDGKIVHPISEMNIAGNHLEFWKNLAELGNDPWVHSSNRTPSLRFTDIQCSGA